MTIGGKTSKNAVIVGGSMAGMVAARVLAGHFERVTIVERDRLPVEPDYRPGVP
ncbi:MAG: 2-polyprenyl-6-methoxyphenol hydroxylase-like oxidoreductase, partial [Acidimicrobiia bacterium]